MSVCDDERNLYPLEAALDALERLHDYIVQDGEQKARECLCQEAAAWRAARKVTVAWREERGMKVRLLDQV